MESSVPTSQQLIQPQDIPIHGPGAAQLQNVLVTMTAASAQQQADGKWDPKIITGKPSLLSQGPPTTEAFCSSSHSSMIAVIGVLCIVYGVVAK
jgi:hypothetical protein